MGQTDLQTKPLRSELNSISRGVGFNLSNVVDEHVFVTLDEVRQLAALQIPDDDFALRRDQAGAVLLYLSGMRAGAFGTLPLAAIDVHRREIKQWPSLGVETKNDKSATTYLLDIPDLLTVVEKWDAFIRTQLPPTAMWYTPTISHWGEQTLSADRPGANRNLAISKRLRRLFDLAGLPYKSPHKFRHGHAVFGLQHAKTMADYQSRQHEPDARRHSCDRWHLCPTGRT